MKFLNVLFVFSILFAGCNKGETSPVVDSDAVVSDVDGVDLSDAVTPAEDVTVVYDVVSTPVDATQTVSDVSGK